jgi:hypothetical protein
MFKLRLIFCLLSISAITSATAQPAASTMPDSRAQSNQWEFVVTPYAWALGISGSVSHGGSTLARVNLSPGSVLSNLKMAAMVVAEARRDRFGLYLDAMYGDLGSSNSRVVGEVDLNANTKIKMGLLTVAPSYTLTQSNAYRLDGLIGARFMWQDFTTTVNAPSIEQSITKSDSLQVSSAVVGLKGRINLGQSEFFVPFYVDAGLGNKSSFTSQAYVGLGHRFHWGDVSLVAKNVYYQFKPSRVTTDMNMFGLALGVTFRF